MAWLGGMGRWAAEAWADWMAAMAWQAAILAAAVWVVAKLVPRSSASFRHTLWLLVFLKLILPPDFAAPWSVGNALSHLPFTIVISSQSNGTAPRALSGETPSTREQGSAVRSAGLDTYGRRPEVERTPLHQNAPLPLPAAASASIWDSDSSSLAPAALVVWGAVTCAMLAAMIVQFRRYRRKAIEQSSLLLGPFKDLAAAQAERLGMRRAVEVRSSPYLSNPAVLGLLRPVVLLPESMVQTLNREDLASLVCHELAHVQRHDIELGWISSVLLCVYWFHPAVWLANFYLRREREMACDDKVLHATRQEGKNYAATILHVAETFDGGVPVGAGFLGLLEAENNLLERIRSVSDTNRPRRAGLCSAAIVMLLAILLVPMGVWTPSSSAQAGPPQPDAMTQPEGRTQEQAAAVPAPDQSAEAIVAALPGRLVSKSTYEHRSRGHALPEPGTVWLKQSDGGSFIAAADLPPLEFTTVAYAGPGMRFQRYETHHRASGGKPESKTRMELGEGTVTVSYQGGDKDGQVETLAVPAEAVFDPNSRPDPYVAANILLRWFDVGPGESKEFLVYDWDNTGKNMASYSIRIADAGRETVVLPSGTFEARHLVQTQLTFGDTWFKKRPDHVTDYWVLDNGVIARILRHREPYEVLLASYEGPEPLPGRVEGQATASAPPTAVASPAAVAQPIGDLFAETDKEIQAHYAKADAEVQEYIRWTASTFGRPGAGLWLPANAYESLSPEEREKKILHIVDVLKGEYGRHLCMVLAEAGAIRDKRLLPGLIKVAAYHREQGDYDCRPKWMAVAAIGRQDDESAVPTLVPLVDHGNQNTRMWARASLVRLTGQNFGADKQAWGKWWNESGKQPPIDLTQLKPWTPPSQEK